MKRWHKLIFALVVIAFVIYGAIPGADTFRFEHGVIQQGAKGCTRTGGCPYTVIWKDKHPSWFDLHAQVQNARGQAASIAYETQRFGATTATAASQGAVATTSFTW